MTKRHSRSSPADPFLPCGFLAYFRAHPSTLIDSLLDAQRPTASSRSG